MQTRFAVLSFLFCLFLAPLHSRASDLALTNTKIYPSPPDPFIENGVIFIHDGRIVAVGPAAKIKIPSGTQTIDCKGLIVTAGFWNSHVHLLPPAILH